MRLDHAATSIVLVLVHCLCFQRFSRLKQGVGLDSSVGACLRQVSKRHL